MKNIAEQAQYLITETESKMERQIWKSESDNKYHLRISGGKIYRADMECPVHGFRRLDLDCPIVGDLQDAIDTGLAKSIDFGIFRIDNIPVKRGIRRDGSGTVSVRQIWSSHVGVPVLIFAIGRFNSREHYISGDWKREIQVHEAYIMGVEMEQVEVSSRFVMDILEAVRYGLPCSNGHHYRKLYEQVSMPSPDYID